MDTAIHFSNNTIKIVTGQAGRDRVRLNSCKTVPLPEGVLINGLITDDGRLKEILTGLRRSGAIGGKAAMVIDSSDILSRAIEIPFMKPANIQKIVGTEFDNLDTAAEAMLFDYTVLEGRIGSENRGRVLCCAMPKAMLDSYRSLFAAAGIQPTVCDTGLNCLIKAASLFPDLKVSPCVLATIDSRVFSCALYAEGQYLFSNRYPLMAEPGTPDYAVEVAGRLSAIHQFFKSEKGNVTLERAYFYGVDKLILEQLQPAAASLGIRMYPLPRSPQITFQQETDLVPGDYLAAIGCLVRK